MDVLGTLAARVLTTRSLVRAPVALYRHGFGWIFGRRLLMLEHVGRRSGRTRYACLEVVDRPAVDRLVIASGFGRAAQWYQNLAAHPACRVSTGRRVSIPASARLLSERESRETLARYQEIHPRAWRLLRRGIEVAVEDPVVGLPMVELTLALSP